MSMGMRVTADERNVDGENNSMQGTSVGCKMYFYGREFCFVLALLFTSYAAFQNAPPKVSKSPLPNRFFPRTSLVADFYYGQLSSAFEKISESDISFVMYYAPWDAESQNLKKEFSLVAQAYYKQVYFAAINCWQPLGECRQQFSKIQHFPVLIAYTQHTKGIQYKGAKESGHMIRFIRSIVQPFSRIELSKDLMDLMASFDATVVGFFDFSGNIGSPGFHTFYSTSLKFLEKDPQREVGFGVVTNSIAAAQFGVFEFPSVRIYMWNETLEYGQHDDYTVDVLTKWISHSVHQVSVWVSPPGVKSLTLSPYVEKGSVLILFTPRNPFLSHNLYYNMMREISLEYYNCDDNPWVQELALHISKKQSEYLDELRNMDSYCDLMTNFARYKIEKRHLSVAWCHHKNQSCCVDKCKLKMDIGWTYVPSLEKSLDNVLAIHQNVENSCPFMQIHEGNEMCKDGSSHGNHSTYRVEVETSMLSDANDERAASAIILAISKDRCVQWNKAKRIHTVSFPGSVFLGEKPSDFKGLACRTNQSLSLLAMDSLQFYLFAEALGLDVLSFPDKTAAVIFNAEIETTYVLNEPVNYASLVDFMMNYTKGLLSRTLRNSSHQYSFSLNKYSEYTLKSCAENDWKVCTQELTSSNFETFVLDNEKDVVLFYHSTYCAFCHSVAHVYLTVARYFRLHHSLKFYRIDGENNDLPWEYTMDRYPTVIFFPALRKSESRVYPSNLPLTVKNLVNFILANLQGLSHMEGILALCTGWEDVLDNVSAKDCVDQVRGKNAELIANSLSLYRKSVFRQEMRVHNVDIRTSRDYQNELQKQSKDLLFQLHTLKEISLLLGSINRLKESDFEYQSIQRSLDKYFKHSSMCDKSDTTIKLASAKNKSQHNKKKAKEPKL